jgi:polyisoprenoid-binding protein YceI
MTVCTALRVGLFATLVAAASGGLAAAPATHYTQDPAKSTLEYSFVQAGAKNSGVFKKYSVALDFAADNLAVSKLEVLVDMGSLDTGDKERDDTLRGADLFSVAKFPQARFTSAQIVKTVSGYDAIGKLTVRGVSRDTHVPFSLRSANEQGKAVSYLTGKTTVKRLDFGVGQGDWKSTEWVSDEVAITYTVRLTATAPQ